MNTTVSTYNDNNLQGTLQAVGGLLLTGAGLSMSIDARFMKTRIKANERK